MKPLRVLDLFSGIGGFSLGLERTGGFETVAFCEIEKYPQQVLAKHWPGVPIYDDVRELTAERLIRDGIGVDIITGGFPCQDISNAGKGAGINEETRSGLWSECARLLGELRPAYAIFENVTALLSGDSGKWFQRVLWDISQVGYDAEWHCISASELGAHHHRDRVWIIAYPAGSEQPKRIDESWTKGSQKITPERAKFPTCTGSVQPLLPDPNSKGLQGVLSPGAIQEWRETAGHSGSGSESLGWTWASEPAVCRVANGIPKRSHRLKALGNAVVRQIPELIGKAILNNLYGERKWNQQ